MNRVFTSKWNDPDNSYWEKTGALSRETLFTYAAIAGMIAAMISFGAEGALAIERMAKTGHWALLAETTMHLSLLGFFLVSALLYVFLRLGYLRRFATHHPVSGAALNRVYLGSAPSVVILVPSYKEEPHVVRRTLMSAALQQSPGRRVVLLIDDPPVPRTKEEAASQARMRSLSREINRFLAAPCATFEQGLSDFLDRRRSGSYDPKEEAERLRILLEQAADWLEKEADNTPVLDHYDTLYLERILRPAASSHRTRAATIKAGLNPCKVDFEQEYRRLAALFKVEVSDFERKQYENLSHEPNKAMNLNSYLGLMGKSFREIDSPEGLILQETHAEDPEAIRIPQDDFIVILDADSLLLPDYTLRLIHFMTQPENSRVAVAQTPYSSVPGAPGELERIAGATTDVQLMSHQGSVLFGAGSWVGASALVRREALDTIATIVEERGHKVSLMIRDRTLTEDTDTTIDLIRKNWTVYNYPDRLAYSATPSDFGSLLIQRRRWATGGLIILGNVARYFFDKPSFRRFLEAAVRANYILSAPVGSIAIVILGFYPFHSFPVSPAPVYSAFFLYLIIYSRDLMHNGFRLRDFFRAMALNAMLLPINLSGALNSLEQLVTGRKIPFQRTPKVPGRTATPPLHIAAQLFLLGYMTMKIPATFTAGNWVQFSFFLFYALSYGYVIPMYIGWLSITEDLLGAAKERIDRIMTPLLARAQLKSLLNKWRTADEE